MIIDCHVHAFEHLGAVCGFGESRAIGGGKVQYATGDIEAIVSPEDGDKELLIETYIEKYMKPFNIDKGVLLQSGFYSLNNLYASDIMKKYPGKFVAACSLDPFCAEKEAIIDNFIHNHPFTIFKFETSVRYGLSGLHKELRLDGPEFQDIYECAAKNNMAVTFDMGSYPQKSYQPELLVKMAKKYPTVRFVVAHMLAETTTINQRWKDDVDLLSTADNIWYDLSCMPCFMKVEDQYPFYDCLEMIEYAADKCGTDHLMWGSDLPMTLVNCTFDKLFDFIRYSKKFTEDDFDNIYAKSAQAAYHIR